MLGVQGLTKHYSAIPAVDDVSLTIHPGEVLGYLGPNGSGKSTTVKMITGLLDPTRGHVYFHGRDIKDDLPGYNARSATFPKSRTSTRTSQYLLLVGRLRCLPEKALGENAGALLRLFGLQKLDSFTTSFLPQGV